MKGFIIKEFFHIFRDRRSLIILFGMPIVQILLFGFAITNEIRNVNIAVLDKARDEASERIIEKMLASGYFVMNGYLETEDEIEPIFRKGKIKAVVVFGPDLDRNLTAGGIAPVQIIADATDPNTANTIAAYAASIVRDYQADINPNVTLPLETIPEVRMLYNPELKGVFMFIPGTMTVILMLVSAMMTSISIAREKEMGTMEVLLVSPLKPVQVVAGKVLPYILLSSINATVILLLGYFVFRMPMQGSLLALMGTTLLFIITTLSLGIFISTVAQTQQMAMMMSLIGLMLPTIMLSGFVFPIDSMPWPLRVLSNIIPAKWFILILKGLMLKGVSITYLWKEVLILIMMTLALIGISVKKYAIRLA
ncbi:MAG: ABC transporter permease [Bacteroidota bacterium]|jgi:ABC-2 type transport system permease protein|nr:MAG: multidrug ABC transporter permease [Bacteroidota bacterium]